MSVKQWADECLKLKEIAQSRNLELSDFENDYITWQQVYFDLKEAKYESYQAGNGLTELDKHAIALIYEIASNRFAAKQSRHIQAGKSHWEKYYEYMKSIAWAQKRYEALKRAGHKCQLCGDGYAILQVHHNSYKNMGNEPLEDLVVLCTDCHEMFHRNRKVK